jgi:hypothetical protein
MKYYSAEPCLRLVRSVGSARILDGELTHFERGVAHGFWRLLASRRALLRDVAGVGCRDVANVCGDGGGGSGEELEQWPKRMTSAS